MDQLQDLEATVAKRMAELKPMVDEYAELERVAQRLGVKPAAAAATAAPVRSRGRSRRAARRTPTRRASTDGAGAAATKTVGRSRSRKPATSARCSARAEQILAMASEQPGITVAQIAKKMGVDATGLYRPVRRLEKEGRLRKSGLGLHAKA
jgi:Mn-dependent DtxR family transcriptional regulator